MQKQHEHKIKTIYMQLYTSSVPNKIEFFHSVYKVEHSYNGIIKVNNTY